MAASTTQRRERGGPHVAGLVYVQLAAGMILHRFRPEWAARPWTFRCQSNMPRRPATSGLRDKAVSKLEIHHKDMESTEKKAEKLNGPIILNIPAS